MSKRKWYDAVVKYSVNTPIIALAQEMYDQYSQEPEYNEITDAMESIYENHPNVMQAVEFDDPVQMGADDVEALRQYLRLKVQNQTLVEEWFMGEILRLRCLLMLKD